MVPKTLYDFRLALCLQVGGEKIHTAFCGSVGKKCGYCSTCEQILKVDTFFPLTFSKRYIYWSSVLATPHRGKASLLTGYEPDLSTYMVQRRRPIPPHHDSIIHDVLTLRRSRVKFYTRPRAYQWPLVHESVTYHSSASLLKIHTLPSGRAGRCGGFT